MTSLLLDSTYASKAHAYVRGVVGADGIYDLPLLLKRYPNYDFVAQAFGSDPSLYADEICIAVALDRAILLLRYS